MKRFDSDPGQSAQSAKTQPSSHALHCVVVGAGVIGLSTAVALMDSPTPFKVTLVSTEFPSGPQPSAEYASAWAGAHHVSAAANDREEQWDRTTLAVLRQLESSDTGGWPWRWHADGTDRRPLLRVKQLELFACEANNEARQRAQLVLSMYPHHCTAPHERSFPPSDSWSEIFRPDTELGWKTAHAFETLDIDVPVYLPALYRRFTELGGTSVTSPHKLESLKEALQIARKASGAEWARPCGVIVAAGTGSGNLQEFRSDADNLFPVRGQTVLVDAPWLCLTSSTLPPAMSRTNEGGERDTYLIPRSGGQYIVGGTRLPYDSDPLPRESTTQEILERALRICPALVAPERRDKRGGQAIVDDVKIVACNVGFRPARRGGPVVRRCPDVEKILPDGPKVVAAYGLGGYGYQSSWGVAFDVRDLMLDALGLPRVRGGTTLSSLGAVSSRM